MLACYQPSVSCSGLVCLLKILGPQRVRACLKFTASVELSSRLYHPRKSILFLNYSEFNSALKTDEECIPLFKKSFSSLFLQFFVILPHVIFEVSSHLCKRKHTVEAVIHSFCSCFYYLYGNGEGQVC